MKLIISINMSSTNVLSYENELLANNTAYIDGDINGDIYTLDDIEFNKKYEPNHPYIVANHTLLFTKKNIYQIRDEIPNFILDIIDKYGLVICGGYMYRILCDNPIEYDAADIDLYIVAPDLNAAQLTKYIDSILNKFVHSNKCISIMLKRNVIELLIDNIQNNISEVIKIQIILSVYKSISQIIHGFDLGACSVAFDGKDIYFTGLSKFAYETGFNIITIDRRSYTFEQRLLKYLTRGFSIIMPNFNLNILKCVYKNMITSIVESFTGYIQNINLPNIEILNANIYGNAIYVDISNIYIKNKDFNTGSDYDSNIDAFENTNNENTEIEQPPIILVIEPINKYITHYHRRLFNTKIKVRPLTRMQTNALYAITGLTHDELNDRIYAEAENRILAYKKNISENGFTFNFIKSDVQYYGIFSPIVESPANWYGIYYIA